MRNKSLKSLVLGVILFATILTTGAIILNSNDWPDPKGSNISTIQNV